MHMLEGILGRHWHHLPSSEVIDLLATDLEQGLDEFEVRHRQEHFGPNVLSPPKGRSQLLVFLTQFQQPLILILLLAVLITAALGEWVDSGVILGVVLINAVIGFLQESKATKALEALKTSMSTEATVVRADKRSRLPSEELVPGDLILLAPGDAVPGDLRLVETRSLQIDESALTGESIPVSKHNERLEHDVDMVDRTNMAYSSTLVTRGTGKGVVTAIADETEIGLISELIASADQLATPLTKKIESFSGILLIAILSMAVVTFVVGFLRGESAFNMFMASVALAIGAIPEGLPAAVTITLSIGVARMARRNAIIRRLPAVETLGSTTVICSDKTGTLTQNRMTVVRMQIDGHEFAVTGDGNSGNGDFLVDSSPVDPTNEPALLECLRSGILCNHTTVSIDHDNGDCSIEGDPTEAALIIAAMKAGVHQEPTRKESPIVDLIPFESAHQFMATLNYSPQTDTRVIHVKGSIESILPKCGSALTRSGHKTDVDVDELIIEADRLASEGLRVMAFATKQVGNEVEELTHSHINTSLTFLGLQAMYDPPRPEVKEAILSCKRSGIQVKVITGDHAATARAIGAEIGLNGSGSANEAVPTLTGKSLSLVNDEQLGKVAEQTVIFSRTAPEQKLRLVEALQAKGHVVAMTGDGVNDAPALRAADIGIAMGATGTEVAKDASDMILTDDNFSTIEAAVEEGRGVFDNLTKFITWTLPTNIGEGLIIMVAILVGVALPILPLQILWINMTTAVLMGLMLAFEPKESGIMDRPPRTPGAPILSRTLVGRIVMVGLLLLIGSFGLFGLSLRTGLSIEESRTVAVNVFVVGELFYLFNCRSLTRSMFSLGLFSNRWLVAGVTLMAALQLFYTYSPTMNTLFGSAPIGINSWALIILVGVVIYVAVGAEKMINARRIHPE